MFKSSMQDAELHDTIDHLFRRHSGHMVAIMCRSFGFDKMETIEDAVQDSLVAAMKTWPYSGIPDNQFAWLLRTAKNRCIDTLRRNNRSVSMDNEELTLPDETQKPNDVRFPGEISEDQLRMVFACCHPDISPDSRVALTLKTVGGFSVAEIANAFLSNDEAVAKLLSRARSHLRRLGVRLEMPGPDELPSRLDSVFKSLYLMFNEGYSASTGEHLIRKDLVFEAIRLASALASHAVTTSPTVDALTALFCFQAARMPARSDHNGELLVLSEQDRETWDKRLISRGIHHLRLSAHGETISDFHLEAEIAAIYTLAADFRSTDWERIAAIYESLLKRHFSPVVALNRAIALGQIHGPQTAYDHLLRIETQLPHYNLFFITKAHYEVLLNQPESAETSLRKALELTSNESIRRFITKKLHNSPLWFV